MQTILIATTAILIAAVLALGIVCMRLQLRLSELRAVEEYWEGEPDWPQMMAEVGLSAWTGEVRG